MSSEAETPKFVNSTLSSAIAAFASLLEGDESGNAIKCERFIESYRLLVTLFEFFGTGFKIASKDLNEKLASLTEVVSQRSVELLAQVMDEETKVFAENPKFRRQASRALQRLTWFLDFTVQLFRGLANAEATPSAAASEAYNNTLHKRHSTVVRWAFWGGIKACPSAATLQSRLVDGEGAPAAGPALAAAMASACGRLADVVEPVRRAMWTMFESRSIAHIK